MNVKPLLTSQKTVTKMKTVFNFLILFCLLSSSATFAQETKTEEVDLYELSLEELLNIPINSASKKDETLFDAPLSSYTITRADIDKSGAVSYTHLTLPTILRV